MDGGRPLGYMAWDGDRDGVERKGWQKQHRWIFKRWELPCIAGLGEDYRIGRIES